MTSRRHTAPRRGVPLRIPNRYRRWVSKQIAVRLPDEVVAFIDTEVRSRRVASRAAFVQAALERERRRLTAARDAQLLSGQAGDPEGFDNLAVYGASLDSGMT